MGSTAALLATMVPSLALAKHDPKNEPNPPATPLILACMQTAVDARETAIDTAVSAYTTAINAALAARKTALHNAWGLSDTAARREAIKAAWKAYREARKTAGKALNMARNDAWKKFKTDAKACGGSGKDEDGSKGEEHGDKL